MAGKKIIQAMRRFVYVAVILGCGLAGAAPFAARAAAAPDCYFRPRLEELRAIQADGTLNYIDAIRAQLAIRKSLLNSAIDCAILDAQNRQKELASVPAAFQSSSISQSIQKQLGDTLDFYSSEQKLVDSLGIKGTQDVAQEVADWRAGTYAPLAAREDNFILWTENQPLFDKTEARLNQIKPLIFSLTILPGSLQSAWNDTQDAWTAAQSDNASAEDALRNGDPAAGHLIQSSLQSLAGIYKNLFGISDQIKNLVP